MAKLCNSVLCVVTYSFKLTRLSSTTAWSADRGGGQCVCHGRTIPCYHGVCTCVCVGGGGGGGGGEIF